NIQNEAAMRPPTKRTARVVRVSSECASMPAVGSASLGRGRIRRAPSAGARMQEDLPLVFAVYGQPEYFGVKLLRALHVIDVEHNVVHPIPLDHSSPPGLSSGVRCSETVKANQP